MVLLFQFINLKYLVMMDARNLKYMVSDEQKEDWIIREMVEFKKMLYVGTGAAITCLV